MKYRLQKDAPAGYYTCGEGCTLVHGREYEFSTTQTEALSKVIEPVTTTTAPRKRAPKKERS